MDNRDDTRPIVPPPKTTKLFRSVKKYRQNVDPTSESTNSESTISWLVSFRIVESGEIIAVEVTEKVTLGRGITSDLEHLHIDLHDMAPKTADSISRLHAALDVQNENLVIQDLGSTNGTFINGNRLEPLVDYKVSDKDTIWLGQFGLRVEAMTAL